MAGAMVAGGSEEEQGSGCCVQTAPRARSDLSLPAASQTSGRASLQHVLRRLCQMPFFYPLRNSWSSSGLPSDACSFSSNSAFSSLLSLLFFSHSIPFVSTSCFLFGSYFISSLLVLPPVPFFSSALFPQSRKAPPALSERSSGCRLGRGGAAQGAGSTWWPLICWVSPRGEIRLLPAQTALPCVAPLAQAVLEPHVPCSFCFT